MEPLPTTIHKHWFGYVSIAVAAASLFTLLYVGFISLFEGGTAGPRLVFMVALVAALSIVTIAIPKYGHTALAA
jgi:hypothetical protein